MREMMDSEHTPVASGLERVLANDLCSGCGICAGLAPHLLEMQATGHGTYRPVVKPQVQARELAGIPTQVCPFSGAGGDEDSIGEQWFGSTHGIQHSEKLGFHVSTYAASLKDSCRRLASSSGGLTTYVLEQLLTRGMVDAVVCVRPTGESATLFEFAVARSADAITQCRKSRYYPVEFSRVLGEVLSTPGRYAFTALPCFAKGLRLAMQQNEILRERIRYIVGLFCGHLKTKQFATYLTRCCGLQDSAVTRVDFRKKIPELSAAHYAFEATNESAAGECHSKHVLMRDVALGSWGLNAFMLKACECCDDVVGELTDISMGDAWLPEYYRDGRGTNFVICRRPELDDILLEGAARGELHLVKVPPSAIEASQSGGFRQRRQGLAYRLHLARQRGEWRPKKRVSPDVRALGFGDRLIQRLRIHIATASKSSFPVKATPVSGFRFALQVVWWRQANLLLLKLRSLTSTRAKR